MSSPFAKGLSLSGNGVDPKMAISIGAIPINDRQLDFGCLPNFII